MLHSRDIGAGFISHVALGTMVVGSCCTHILPVSSPDPLLEMIVQFEVALNRPHDDSDHSLYNNLTYVYFFITNKLSCR